MNHYKENRTKILKAKVKISHSTILGKSVLGLREEWIRNNKNLNPTSERRHVGHRALAWGGNYWGVHTPEIKENIFC